MGKDWVNHGMKMGHLSTNPSSQTK